MQALRTVFFLERDSCETWEIFKNTLFYWKSPVAASDSFRFPALKAVAQAYSVKKVFLEVSQNLQENTCARKTPGQVCNFIKIETLAQAFSCEFCKISKSTFSYRLPTVAPSAACSFIKIEIPTKMFFYEFGKISKNIFWQSTSRWLLLKIICEFWQVFQNISFIEHLWETAYFTYKLQHFNQQIQWRTISQVLFKHRI